MAAQELIPAMGMMWYGFPWFSRTVGCCTRGTVLYGRWQPQFQMAVRVRSLRLRCMYITCMLLRAYGVRRNGETFLALKRKAGVSDDK